MTTVYLLFPLLYSQKYSLISCYSNSNSFGPQDLMRILLLTQLPYGATLLLTDSEKVANLRKMASTGRVYPNLIDIIGHERCHEK